MTLQEKSPRRAIFSISEQISFPFSRNQRLRNRSQILGSSLGFGFCTSPRISVGYM